MSAPLIPHPPASYDHTYFSRVWQVLRTYFNQLDSVRHVNAASQNFDLGTLPSSSTGLRLGDVYRAAGNFLKVLTSDSAATEAAALAASHTHDQYLSVPKSSNTSGTLVAGDKGLCLHLTAGVTVPANVFAEGNVVSLDNTTAGNLTVTQGSGLTMYLAGTATTSDRTLAQNGLATIRFRSATVCVISGAGVT